MPPRGKHRQAAQRGELLHAIDDAAAGEQGRESDLVRDAEQVVLPRVAEVRVDQQRALADLRKRHREVGRKKAATFIAPRAQDGEGIVAPAPPATST